MKILYVEPYYSGSHKHWIDSYKKYSKHKIDILSLPGKKWKWRMHGGAITLAKKFNALNKSFDIIICSDMLNLPIFKSLCNKKILYSKIVMYYHENQLTYPWSPEDVDVTNNRDLHYAFINYTSSLISDYNYFNSQYHYESYIDGLKKYLNKMPDFQNKKTINEIKYKSDILHIGCELKNNFTNKIIKKKNKPIILWNHRWEYDKNPDLFFKTLFEIKKNGIKFSLVVLGKKYKKYPEIFNKAKRVLKNEIIHFGFCNSRDEYLSWLNKSDILPVTSNQDFFGISIMEAVCSNCYPILPNRLTYPELFGIKDNPEYFYHKDNDLKNKIIKSIININELSLKVSKTSKELIEKYDWSVIVKKYDSIFYK